MIGKNGTGDGRGDCLYGARRAFGDGRLFGNSHEFGNGFGDDSKYEYSDGHCFGDGHGGGVGSGFGESEYITALIIENNPVTMAYQAATLQTSGG